MSLSMDTHVTDHAPMIPKRESEEAGDMPKGPMTSNMLSHTLAANDPDNPMNWPTHRRVYASAVAWAMAYTVYVSTR